VPLEFLSWFLWLGAFAALQNRLCRRYPGIRSVCRAIFLLTAVVAVAPAAWILFTGLRNFHLIAAVNHVFGMGVYAQTFLRAALLFQWLAWPGGHSVFPAPEQAPPSFESEAQLVAVMVALTGQIVSARRESGVPDED
jgi:hypothetical protein